MSTEKNSRRKDGTQDENFIFVLLVVPMVGSVLIIWALSRLFPGIGELTGVTACGLWIGIFVVLAAIVMQIERTIGKRRKISQAGALLSEAQAKMKYFSPYDRDALVLLEQILQLDRANEEAKNLLSVVAREIAEWWEGPVMLEGLDHVLRIDPSNEEVKRLRNKLHAQLLAGRLATDALSPQARFVDVSQQMRGRIAQQIAPYNSSVEKNPQSPKTYFDRAKFLALQGEYLEIAMNDCTKAIELWNLNKEIPLEDIYELRAACQSYRDGLGDFEAAISDYSRAIEVAPDNARLYQNRGACYKKRGKTVEAKADFEKAITLIEAFPNKPDHTKERLDAIRQEL